MLGFPSWYVEGLAVLVSGGGAQLTYRQAGMFVSFLRERDAKAFAALLFSMAQRPVVLKLMIAELDRQPGDLLELRPEPPA
ncbi:hypothetical protein CCR94_18655 [Rhodoblastus sphagnicola]|uniref:Uncharacterized protein n=1 Tax=Rhodoblastus sphagnicola TaxID=333368 RepID=A0A2S6N0C5_9HYPH|nr:hypothetical protein [Rhodoblastus sphagnicola]PPQ28071.1 hypothetical protein CCR94_18655 [Rhodoblastus sphagnicola]